MVLLKNKMTEDELIQEYIDSMTEQDRIVLEIAKDHLGSSFDILKSIGFETWLKERSQSKL